MEHGLIISNIVLWIAVVALAAVVLALLRQVGILHERIAPAGALLGREGPQPGEPAPILEVEDWSGQALRIGGADKDRRATLLFFVSPTCPVCKTLLPQVRAVCAAEEESPKWILASDGPREEHIDFVDANVLDDESYVLSSPLGLAFQVGRLPYAVLIDEVGVVRARGLVNTREHLESLFAARELGVASVQEYLANDSRKRVA